MTIRMPVLPPQKGGTCPKCKSYFMTGAFCREDGLRLSAIACKRCGSELIASDKFCAACGKALER